MGELSSQPSSYDTSLDTALALANTTLGDQTLSKHLNGAIGAVLLIEGALGTGNSIRGSFLTLAERLLTVVATSGGVPSGTAFPLGPNNRQFFWRADENKLYVFDLASGQWKSVVGFITASEIAPGAVTGPAIADGSITDIKLSGTFPPTRIGAGTFVLGVVFPAAQLGAGGVPAGVTIPAGQVTGGTLTPAVVLPVVQLGGPGGLPLSITVAAAQISSGAFNPGVTLPAPQVTPGELQEGVTVRTSGIFKQHNRASNPAQVDFGGPPALLTSTAISVAANSEVLVNAQVEVDTSAAGSNATYHFYVKTNSADGFFFVFGIGAEDNIGVKNEIEINRIWKVNFSGVFSVPTAQTITFSLEAAEGDVGKVYTNKAKIAVHAV